MSVSNMFREEHDDILDDTSEDVLVESPNTVSEPEPEDMSTEDVLAEPQETVPNTLPGLGLTQPKSLINKLNIGTSMIFLISLYYTVFGVTSIDFICLLTTVVLTGVLLLNDMLNLGSALHLQFVTHLSLIGCEILWLTRMLSLVLWIVFYFGFSNTIAVVYAVSACLSVLRINRGNEKTSVFSFVSDKLFEFFGVLNIDISAVGKYTYSLWVDYLSPVVYMFYSVIFAWGEYLGNNQQSKILNTEVKTGTVNQCVNLAGAAYRQYTINQMQKTVESLQNIEKHIGRPLFNGAPSAGLDPQLDELYKRSYTPHSRERAMSQLNKSILDLEDSDDDLDTNPDTLDTSAKKTEGVKPEPTTADREEARKKLRQKMAEKRSARTPQRNTAPKSVSKAKIPQSVLSAVPPELHTMTEILMKGNNLDTAFNMIKREQAKTTKDKETHIQHLSKMFNETDSSEKN